MKSKKTSIKRISDTYDKLCYCDEKIKHIIKFKSEIEPTEILVTRNIFKQRFPKIGKIDYKLLRMTNIGIYSIAKPEISNSICKYILKYTKTKNITITDALANVGGMTIMFAHIFDNVNTCEIIPLHCQILKNNLTVYNLINKVNIICDDYMSVMFTFKQDVIFFDPPWGGTDYIKKNDISLCINNINIACIINQIILNVKFIFLLVPSNFHFNHFFKLLDSTIKINIHPLCNKLNEFGKLLIVIITPFH